MRTIVNDIEELVIARVGAQGDGVADSATGPRYVPFTLAGERVSATFNADRGRLNSILRASPDRVAPVCHHFGVCGGCALQHMASEPYANWKREQVVAAFRSRGIEATVDPLLRPESKRRRAVFTVRRTVEGIAVGFHEVASHELVNLSECPVVEQRIASILPGLKWLLEPLVSRRGEAKIAVTATASGLDVDIGGVERTLSAPIRVALAREAAALGLARISVDSEPVYEALSPFLVFGSAEVAIPPGIFIQAVAEAEQAMVRIIIAELGKAKKVTDLFAGLGAFSFPIAHQAKVFAVDSDRTAIAALALGARKAMGLKPITTLVRDLFREPLSALELNEHDAVVFDPPRAGAEAQAKMLAKSKVKTVVAVSCNPATLARDARVLIDGGYRLERVTPIDQFQYSPHIEVVSVFRR